MSKGASTGNLSPPTVGFYGENRQPLILVGFCLTTAVLAGLENKAHLQDDRSTRSDRRFPIFGLITKA
jgi:hypothetical protein